MNEQKLFCLSQIFFLLNKLLRTYGVRPPIRKSIILYKSELVEKEGWFGDPFYENFKS